MFEPRHDSDVLLTSIKLLNPNDIDTQSFQILIQRFPELGSSSVTSIYAEPTVQDLGSLLNTTFSEIKDYNLMQTSIYSTDVYCFIVEQFTRTDQLFNQQPGLNFTYSAVGLHNFGICFRIYVQQTKTVEVRVKNLEYVLKLEVTQTNNYDIDDGKSKLAKTSP